MSALWLDSSRPVHPSTSLWRDSEHSGDCPPVGCWKGRKSDFAKVLSEPGMETESEFSSYRDALVCPTKKISLICEANRDADIRRRRLPWWCQAPQRLRGSPGPPQQAPALCDLGSSPFCSLHLPLILVSSPHYALMTPHISTIRSSKDPSGEWLVGLTGEGLCFVIYDEP